VAYFLQGSKKNAHGNAIKLHHHHERKNLGRSNADTCKNIRHANINTSKRVVFIVCIYSSATTTALDFSNVF
jgi:hypothetical protein